MMSATGLSEAIVSLTQQLAESVRDGTPHVADARTIVHNIREAEGWLISTRRLLNPEDPLGSETGQSQLIQLLWVIVLILFIVILLRALGVQI